MSYVEIFIGTPLSELERRDPKVIMKLSGFFTTGEGGGISLRLLDRNGREPRVPLFDHGF